jgi:protein O-mannosyl-transferase
MTPAIRRRVLATALVIGGVAVYANSFAGTFLFDDVASIADNASIRSLSGAFSPPTRGEAVSGRPIVNLSLAINYAVGGLDPAGYHAFNLALHIACALLLYLVIVHETRSDGLAFACAAVWMVHPLQSEVVDYTVARTESLMALCLLGTLYAAIRGWTALAVVFCAVGMACKETMVVAPAVVVLWDFCTGRPARRSLYLGLAATWGILLFLLRSSPRAHSAGFAALGDALHPSDPWSYLLNQSVLIVRYLKLTIWPIGLVLDYGYPRALALRDVMPQVLLLLVLLAAAIVLVRRRPVPGFLAAAFFVTLAPSSSIVPIATEVGAERRMYVPAMALIVLAVLAAWMALRRHPRVAWSALAVLSIALSLLTVRRNVEYRSALAMWATNVERWPNGRARSNLAAALQMAHRDDEVVPQLRAAVADYPEARYSLGTHLLAQGATDEGVRALEQFVREFPTHPDAAGARTAIDRANRRTAGRLTDEAIARAAAGKIQEAVALFRQAAMLAPENAGAHRNLANALLDAREFDAAIAEAREALRLDPREDVAREILRLAEAEKKKGGGATAPPPNPQSAIRNQKSNCAPILKNRAWMTFVGFSQFAAVADVENAVLTVYGQALLKML